MSYCVGNKVLVNGSIDGRSFCNEKGTIDLIDKSGTPTHMIVFDNPCVKPWYVFESMLTLVNTLKFKVGDRVAVNGRNDGKTFCNAIGTIIRTNDRYQPYYVKFDDTSILTDREGWWVRKDQVTAYSDYLAVGTLVKVCGYSFNGDYFSQEGKIYRVDANDKNYTYQVEFSSGRAAWFQLASLTVIKPCTPSASTETYKTTWSKNPSQRFGVYKNGRLLSSYMTYGEASSVASALNKESCINSYTVQVI